MGDVNGGSSVSAAGDDHHGSDKVESLSRNGDTANSDYELSRESSSRSAPETSRDREEVASTLPKQTSGPAGLGRMSSQSSNIFSYLRDSITQMPSKIFSKGSSSGAGSGSSPPPLTPVTPEEALELGVDGHRFDYERQLVSQAKLDEPDEESGMIMMEATSADTRLAIDYVVEKVVDDYVCIMGYRKSKNVFKRLSSVLQKAAQKMLELDGKQYTREHDQKLQRLLREYWHDMKMKPFWTQRQCCLWLLKPKLRTFFMLLVDNKLEVCREFSNEFPTPAPQEIPRLNVVILLVGSRGDVQPYLALGKELQKSGHSVRIATHEAFRQFVTSHGMEFFPVPGDPKALIEIMVKHSLLSPGMAVEGWKTKRPWIKELLPAAYASCTTPLDGSQRYRADLIIANPPSFAAPHVAWKLSIPCHYSFTMPWSPTCEIESPFIQLFDKFNVHTTQGRYLSYRGVDAAIWTGIGDIVQDWRVHQLNIPRIRRGHRIVRDKSIPFTYCFSEHLLPRPQDWEPWISVCGFWFLDNPDVGFSPPEDLLAFLKRNKDSPPIFIGFGSIVIEDPEKFTELIVEAVQRAGVCAILQQGWAGIGEMELPDSIYLIGVAPHDWLFDRCRAVVHHGGAGTTAAGLRMGKPTMIVPFFGDQFFWGSCVERAGVGPTAIPHSKLTAQRFADGIQYLCQPDTMYKARELGLKIQMESEAGLKKAVDHIHKQLPIGIMRCESETCRTRRCASVYNKTLEVQLCVDCDLRQMQSRPEDDRYEYSYVDWSDDGPLSRLGRVMGPKLGNVTQL